jgi:hypothetical protein
MPGLRHLNGALLLAVLLLTPACTSVVAGDGLDTEEHEVRAPPRHLRSSPRTLVRSQPDPTPRPQLPPQDVFSAAEQDAGSGEIPPTVPPPPPDAHFEKTLAAQIEKALDKEFVDADQDGEAVVFGEGAGRSFNETKEEGQLETVVRVSRTGGGNAREVIEKDGHREDPRRSDGTAVATSDEGRSRSDESGGARKHESLLERLGSTALEIDRALGGKETEDDVERLVDARDNEFVISNPKSGTMELQQDLRLISDLVIVFVASAVGAMIFTLIGQPLITGYLIAGSFVGPGGLGLVVELVQVETLAQFGIIFLLFALGVEFSFAKLQHVQSVAVFGGAMEILLMMLVCGVISDFTGAPSKEGVFVGAFLSMSSTAVVIKCLMERNVMGTLPGQITIGTLIFQDCTVGLLFALLPVLGGTNGVGEGVVSLLRTAVLMCLFFAFAIFLSKSMVPRLFSLVSRRNSAELYQMVALAFCLAVAWTSEK